MKGKGEVPPGEKIKRKSKTAGCPAGSESLFQVKASS
jgi:hypothetical protein